MQLYPKPSAELVLDLIAASNPSLPFPLTTASVFVGPPTAVAVVPPAITNTTARVSSKPSSAYAGSKIVSYRRISLADLFKNITPNVKKYSASGDAGASPFSVYGILPYLNDVYGMKLTVDDVNDAAFPAYTTVVENGISVKVSTVSMVAKATSTAFVGSVLIRTQSGQRDLSAAITKGELPGRLYPGGNDFVTTPKDRLDMMGYGTDWTEMMLAPSTSGYGPAYMVWRDFVVGAGNSTANATTQQKFFDAINAELGTSLTTGHQTSTPAVRWNLVGAVTTIVTLPNASYPEANSKDYNRVAVIKPAAAHAWAVGAMYLHFNL